MVAADAGPLDAAALAAFERDGFLALPGLLSPSHVASLKLDFDSYMEAAGFSETHGSEGGTFEDSATPRLTQVLKSSFVRYIRDPSKKLYSLVRS